MTTLMRINVLGEPQFPSPIRRTVRDDLRGPERILRDPHAAPSAEESLFEVAGKTGLVIGYLHDQFIHVPIELLASGKKSMDPDGFAWSAVLAATGQPARFR